MTYKIPDIKQGILVRVLHETSLSQESDDGDIDMGLVSFVSEGEILMFVSWTWYNKAEVRYKFLDKNGQVGFWYEFTGTKRFDGSWLDWDCEFFKYFEKIEMTKTRGNNNE